MHSHARQDLPPITTGFVSSDLNLVTALEVQANRFQLVSRLADDLAHEIKNPLHAMVINLELVKRRVQAGDAAKAMERAEVVAAEVMRLNELIDQLLQLLRPAKKDGPVTDVDGVLGEVVPLLALQARLSGVQLVYHEIGTPAAASIRREALKLVLLNLVANALARLRASGGSVEVAAIQDADGVRLLVTDAGAGSSLDAEARLPASPAPAEPELGLAVARQLVAEAGGALGFTRGEDGATVFAARLPVGPAA